MATILDRIVISKRQEIAAAKQQVSEAELAGRLSAVSPPRDFLGALTTPPGVQIIAEIKKASPSAGQLRDNADVVAIAKSYAHAGAACISVLTDGPFFQGSLADLARVRQAVALPLLRKDFILDRYQILEARLAGADAVLLIAEILDDGQLTQLMAETWQLGMTALVECYEPVNLGRIIAAGARVIGINNRNLHTFATSLEHTINLASRVPRDRCLVSESGIRSRGDILRLESAGVKAVLIGETLMRAENITAKIDELRGV
jgi:indole-3-glycerol phosphate synthase